jgi:S-adenosylmethionine:tRNA ribosyltransferase-isomerase
MFLQARHRRHRGSSVAAARTEVQRGTGRFLARLFRPYDPGVPAAPGYDLPEEAIAQVPAEPRDAARLLVDRGPGRDVAHLRVTELPRLVGPGDVLVLNETRVLPARLRLTKTTGGAVEVLLLEPDGDERTWRALVRPGRRVAPGSVLVAGDDLSVEIGERLDGGQRRVRIDALDVTAALERHGEVPLPPYLTQGIDAPERYQTVYASRPGSVAAPTAGLHLTDAVLERCTAAGARVERLDLAVGLGTFRPVTAERLEDHDVHEEPYAVPEQTLAACREAERVIAIGTTTVRALETAATTGEARGRSRLLIHGDYDWRLVDALVTNFHLPHSTLLLLVESFVGSRWRELYDIALAEGYRFLSFGDAMFLERAR